MTNQPLTNWHAERRQSIGASEIPTVLGLNRFQTPYDLWLIKTGRIPAPDLSGVPAVEIGKALEGPLIDLFAKLRGIEIEHEGTTAYRCPEHSFLSASPDGWVIEDGKRVGLVEVKTTRAWTTPPPYVVAQVHQQMLVTGMPWVIIIALVSGELRSWTIEADPEWQSRIVEAGARFWDHVLADVPPPGAPEPEPRQGVDAPSEIVEAVETLRALQRERLRIEDAEKRLRQRVLEWAEQAKAETISAAGLDIARVACYTRRSLDTRALRLAHPDIAEKFEVESTAWRLTLKD